MGHEGKVRIGNRRRACATCNNWAANVSRLTAKQLRERHSREWELLRLKVEMDLYPQVIADYAAQRKLDEQEQLRKDLEGGLG